MTDILMIAQESPVSEDARRLIDGSEAALAKVYTPEECFSFSPEELDTPDTAFLVARQDAVALGCIALVANDGYGEIKRLYVDDAARGRDIGAKLVEALEAEARRRGITHMMLETGDKLATAVKLYRRLGYTDCGPFGGYPDIDATMFMEKKLA